MIRMTKHESCRQYEECQSSFLVFRQAGNECSDDVELRVGLIAGFSVLPQPSTCTDLTEHALFGDAK